MLNHLHIHLSAQPEDDAGNLMEERFGGEIYIGRTKELSPPFEVETELEAWNNPDVMLFLSEAVLAIVADDEEAMEEGVEVQLLSPEDATADEIAYFLRQFIGELERDVKNIED